MLGREEDPPFWPPGSAQRGRIGGVPCNAPGQGVAPVELIPAGRLEGGTHARCRALVRLLVRPVAEKAASEAEKRSAEAAWLAVDGLYERLKGNDFRHVEDGLKALEDRIDEARKDFGQRLEGVETQLGAWLDRARQDRKDMEGRLMAAIEGKPREGP